METVQYLVETFLKCTCLTVTFHVKLTKICTKYQWSEVLLCFIFVATITDKVLEICKKKKKKKKQKKTTNHQNITTDFKTAKMF